MFQGSSVISKSIIHARKYFKEQQRYLCFLQLMAGENYCSAGQVNNRIWQEDFESLTSPYNYLTLFFPTVFSLGASHSATIFIGNFFFHCTQWKGNPKIKSNQHKSLSLHLRPKSRRQRIFGRINELVLQPYKLWGKEGNGDQEIETICHCPI